MSLVLSEFDAARGIGRLTLNRPEVLNALDVPMARAFLEATRRLTSQPDLRAIVLTGAGKSFAAGGDVDSFAARGIDQAHVVINELLDALNPAIVALRQSPAPVLCAVRGAAAGAGLALALSGDLIVAESQARFIVAYDKLGASPDCGTSWFLPRRVGRGLAFDMMLTGRTLTAAEALACRLVDRVETDADFDASVQALAARIASGPTLAYGRYKTLLDGGLGLPEHLEAERRGFIAATRTRDFAEGVAAFTQKRKPDFKGH
jgi:2-(1,2-epoxy-1,2-dihydrophenyl)acetyl-CoA isomerase